MDVYDEREIAAIIGYAEQLVVLCAAVDEHEYERKEHPQAEYKEMVNTLREIGVKLNDLGGFQAMAVCCRGASAKYRNTGNTLNHHWHGIGEWCCLTQHPRFSPTGDPLPPR